LHVSVAAGWGVGSRRLTLGWVGAYLGTYIGYTHAVSGRRGEALSILETLKQRYEKGIGSPYDIAVIYTGLRREASLVAMAG